MARFGDNLRVLRKSLGLNQKELAAKIRNEDGADMHQAHLSKLEGLDFAPRPDTVARVATGIAPLMKLSVHEVISRLLDGVAGRYDAISRHRATTAQSDLDRLAAVLDRLSPAKRKILIDELERRATELRR